MWPWRVLWYSIIHYKPQKRGPHCLRNPTSWYWQQHSTSSTVGRGSALQHLHVECMCADTPQLGFKLGLHSQRIWTPDHHSSTPWSSWTEPQPHWTHFWIDCTPRPPNQSSVPQVTSLNGHKSPKLESSKIETSALYQICTSWKTHLTWLQIRTCIYISGI